MTNISRNPASSPFRSRPRKCLRPGTKRLVPSFEKCVCNEGIREGAQKHPQLGLKEIGRASLALASSSTFHSRALYAAAGGSGTMKKEPSRDLCIHRETGRHLAACQAGQEVLWLVRGSGVGEAGGIQHQATGQCGEGYLLPSVSGPKGPGLSTALLESLTYRSQHLHISHWLLFSPASLLLFCRMRQTEVYTKGYRNTQGGSDMFC